MIRVRLSSAVEIKVPHLCSMRAQMVLWLTPGHQKAEELIETMVSPSGFEPETY